MDLFGPLPISKDNNKYILVLQCTFTRFVEIYPIPNAQGTTVADIIANNFITRHGIPYEFLSDNGPPFNATLMSILRTTLSISPRFTPPLHPQANGLVERFMQPLKTMITSFVNENHNNWDTYLRHFRFAYNTSFHPSINDTPFFLTHGRDANTSIFIPPSSDAEIDLKTFKQELIHRIVAARQFAKSFSINDHLQFLVPPKFSPGDAVLLFTPPKTISSTSKYIAAKLTANWNGPYRIHSQQSDSTFTIIDSTGKIKDNITVSRLKHYFSRNIDTANLLDTSISNSPPSI